MQAHEQLRNLEVVLSQQQIADKVAELAAQIRDAYPTEKPLLVSVLKGSVVFLADLVRELGPDWPIDFMAVSSYEGDSSTGAVEIRLDLGTNIEGRHVLLIEDIVDTGLTLSYLLEVLRARRPRSVRVAALLFKPSVYRAKAPLDFVGFELPPEFVVGYGMDLDEDWRGLPYVAVLRKSSPIEPE